MMATVVSSDTEQQSVSTVTRDLLPPSHRELPSELLSIIYFLTDAVEGECSYIGGEDFLELQNAIKIFRGVTDSGSMVRASFSRLQQFV